MQIPVHLLKLKAESIQHSQTHYLSLHPSTSPLSTASGPTCGRNLAPHLWTFRCFSHVLKVLLLKKGLRIITTRKTNFSVGGGANTFRLTLKANSVLNKNVVFASFVMSWLAVWHGRLWRFWLIHCSWRDPHSQFCHVTRPPENSREAKCKNMQKLFKKNVSCKPVMDLNQGANKLKSTPIP